MKKTKGIKLLVVYNQLHVVTLAQYMNIMQQKALEKEVVKDIKEQMRKDEKWLKQLWLRILYYIWTNNSMLDEQLAMGKVMALWSTFMVRNYGERFHKTFKASIQVNAHGF